MKAAIIPIGSLASGSLPAVLSSLTVTAAGSRPIASPVHILTLDTHPSDRILSGITGDLNRCHDLFAAAAPSPFPFSYQLKSFAVDYPPLSGLCSRPSDQLFLSALRGRGQPLSYRTDREVVEWSAGFLLDQADSDLVQMLREWTDSLQPDDEEELRLILIADTTDACSAGLALSLLPFFRSCTGNAHTFISLLLLAVPNREKVRDDIASLDSFLEALERRELLASPMDAHTEGADAAWIYSLPSSCMLSAESAQPVFLFMAQTLFRLISEPSVPSRGLHTLSFPGELSLNAWGKQAIPAAALIRTVYWSLYDLIPELRNYSSLSSLSRTLSPSHRSGLYRRFFRFSKTLPPELAVLERTFRALLTEILAVTENYPAFRDQETDGRTPWDSAVASCGRYVTIASEYRVLMEEAEASGLTEVKPVHRVSLEDTEEEKQLQRLQDMKQQLEAEQAVRTEALAALGGYRGCLVLQDCLMKCQASLANAEKKMASLMTGNTEPLQIGLQERRIRLLKAAVSQSREDLDKALSYPMLSGLPAKSPRSHPAQSLLSDEAVRLACQLLQIRTSFPEQNPKDSHDGMPGMFRKMVLKDRKAMMRDLISATAGIDWDNPLSSLFSCVYSLCFRELSGTHIPAPDQITDYPLLPDILPSEPFVSVSALRKALPGSDAPKTDRQMKGLLAFLFLRLYRRRTADEAVLERISLTGQDSPFLRIWLKTAHAGCVDLFTLSNGQTTLPIACIIPGRSLIPARLSAGHLPLIPSFVHWFQRESLTFQDPFPFLGVGDRAILTDRLQQLLAADALSDRLRQFLSDFLAELNGSAASVQEDAFLTVRLCAVCGLLRLPAFRDLLCRETVFHERFLTTDPIATSLSGNPDISACKCTTDELPVYTWKGIPFARESETGLLEAFPVPEEKHILSMLKSESDILYHASDDYREQLCKGLQSLLAAYPNASDSCRRTAFRLMEESEKPLTDKYTELMWPWDSASPSLRTLMEECLGPSLAPAAVCPFSELLTVFPVREGDIIGDSMLSRLCTLLPVQEPASGDEEKALPTGDALLPPLSAAFAAALCRSPEGRTLLSDGFLSFERTPSGSIRVTVSLEGSFTLRLIREYTDQDTALLYAQDIPTLALWPSVPFEAAQWAVYYTYAHLPASLSITAYTETGNYPLSADLSGRAVARLSSYPLCYSLYYSGHSAGALPNLLPVPEKTPGKETRICIDFGSSACSVVLSSASGLEPLQGSVMVRSLLNNPASSKDLLRNEFIPAAPLPAVLPATVRLFRNVPSSVPAPIEDGIILSDLSLSDIFSLRSIPLYTSLKWDEEKGRSASICLHQVMLMAALQARSNGAASVSWRFALPDAMAAEGRQNLRNLFCALADRVRQETAIPFPERNLPVSFASESTALGAYFRMCAAEDTRGGFMVLDLGANTADLSLFLRGREQAVCACQLPLGIQYMLLPYLIRNPDILLRDYESIADAECRQNLMQCCELLAAASHHSAALKHARLSLDALIAQSFPTLHFAAAQRLSEGVPAYSASLILFHLSYLMMLSGLLLLQVSEDSGKNDILPEQMTLCLAGRGALLMESLSGNTQQSLWRFMTMFRNRRILSLSFLYSAEKKAEIASGLTMFRQLSSGMPSVASAPAVLPVSPDELLPEFLLRFQQEFPADAAQLFPGFFTGFPGNPITDFGMYIIDASIRSAFSDPQGSRPFDSLAAWPGLLLDFTGEKSAAPYNS